MNVPTLYVFAISHYCEKARWALDYLRINYLLEYLPPGMHRRATKKMGANTSALPILQVGTQIIQGSTDIITWAEDNKGLDANSLNSETNSEANMTFDLDGMEIEKRLDDVLGVHVRRYYYSEAMLDYPHLVRPIFVKDLKPFQQKMTNIGWGMIRNAMIRAMDLGHAQGLESRQYVAQELDWLDQLLADGRPFLNGSRFSRIDITAASLLSPLVKPEEHPTYAHINWPPNVAVDCEAWRERPCFQWVNELYRKYRR
jgi:glutathione S-transferase